MSPEQLAELLYKKSDDGKATEEFDDAALAQLLALDTERVNKLKPDTKAIFDNGYKKAQSEVAAQWEKTLREQFKVDAENSLQGEALVEAIKAAMADSGAKPDKIKVSKEYLELEASMKKALKEADDGYKAKIAEMEAGYKKEQVWGQAASLIREALQGLNPVLPADTAKADRLINLFMSEFREFDFEPDPVGGLIPTKGGERVQDKHGYARNLSDIVKERAEAMFDFREQEAAGNAGNKNGPPARLGVRFKDEAEYLRQYAAAPDAAAKNTLYEAWKAQAQAQAN